MSHIVIYGLVVAGLYLNPYDYDDVVSPIVHKTLLNLRRGIISSNNEKIINKINRKIFPGVQVGPLEYAIAEKTITFYGAMNNDFKAYQKQIFRNLHIMCDEFEKSGFKIQNNSTATDLFDAHSHNTELNGNGDGDIFSKNNIITNRNVVFNVPLETLENIDTRIESPAIATRGFKENESRLVVKLFDKILENKNKNFKA